MAEKLPEKIEYVQTVADPLAAGEIKDDLLLEAMGYEQHMKRGFSMWSLTAFCLTGLGLLPSLGGTLWFSLGYLGLLPMTWGWLIATIFIHTMVFSLAELGSAYPTAGGLYYWTYLLAPKGIKAISCWITAWSMVISAVLGAASMFMTQAQMLESFVIMFNPDWYPTDWQTYLIYLAHIILCGLVMCAPSKTLGQISTVFAWVGTIAFFIILIVLPIKTPQHTTAKQIFTEAYNQTGWSNKGLVFLFTFLTPSWCISGYDSTVHLAEETSNAAWVVPNAMWISTLSLSILGYIFNVVLAYCSFDIDAIIGSSLGQPLGAILVSACGNGALTKVLWAATVISNFGVIFVMTTSSSRIIFAYARDGALPFQRWMSHVNRVTKTPINATVALCISVSLVGLISLGSSTALNAFFAGSSLAGAIAYLMPVLMRCINENNPDYHPGVFSMGKWSKPVRWIAVIWAIFMLPIFSFPTTPNPTAKTFKWTVPIYIGIMCIIVPWYFFRARKWFFGPAGLVEGH
ncbi:amino acid permease [Mollisia scopiformis]|uniref:Amino acid permease n=1 Tax=Mollisia scopiformis TaxID=149040 RepID=A0A194XAD8_MOLSC|nr:amino acid permease [Mollisia scopiformis]KUJ17104.1 amino acid permease [Mollisia scopiformis]